MDRSCELIKPGSSCERDKASSRSFHGNDGNSLYFLVMMPLSYPVGIWRSHGETQSPEDYTRSSFCLSEGIRSPPGTGRESLMRIVGACDHGAVQLRQSLPKATTNTESHFMGCRLCTAATCLRQVAVLDNTSWNPLMEWMLGLERAGKALARQY